ncbi:MAG TPA: Ada metal-binding domain-containing protein, partial [Planctomycetota bacterium]|nr:Ada metal-binding domain-containing protein [Planctomycetota bacterium]
MAPTATLPPRAEMLAAVRRRDARYEGVFVLAVRTTGVACRPGCPARTPRPENVEFFA